jgi:hypothetical protein
VVTAAALVADVEHFRRRLIVDCCLEMTSAYWEKRAQDFEAVGTPTAAETAQACRNRARVAQLGGDVEEFYELLAGLS